MRSPLVPARRRGQEILDAPDVDPWLVRRSLRDVARANLVFGGRRAVLAEVVPLLARLGREATLLDVGTGLGDIPARARAAAAARGVRLCTIGLDAAEELAVASRPRVDASVCGSALALPFATGSVDVVTCSQLLHHFSDEDGRAVIGELDRVARVRVVISDIRRSWLAAGGLWAASFPLGFHPVSRHDGVLSVLRGFTTTELDDAVRCAVGRAPTIARRLGWRITASWEPGGACPRSA